MTHLDYEPVRPPRRRVGPLVAAIVGVWFLLMSLCLVPTQAPYAAALGGIVLIGAAAWAIKRRWFSKRTTPGLPEWPKQ